MKYIEFCEQLVSNKIKLTDDLGIEVTNKKGNTILYKWDKEYMEFIRIEDNEVYKLNTEYNQLELLELEIKPISLKSVEDASAKNTLNKAKAIVIEELETMYVELELDLDACQGCTTDLDVKFSQLTLYSTLVKFLGGDLDKDKQRIIDKVYKNNKEPKKELQNNEELEQSLKSLFGDLF